MNPNGSKVSDVVLLWFDFFVRLASSNRSFELLSKLVCWLMSRLRCISLTESVTIAFRHRIELFSKNILSGTTWIVASVAHDILSFLFSHLFRTNQSNCRSSKKKLQIAEIERQTKALETKQKELGITNAREQRQHEKENGSIGD